MVQSAVLRSNLIVHVIPLCAPLCIFSLSEDPLPCVWKKAVCFLPLLYQSH